MEYLWTIDGAVAEEERRKSEGRAKEERRINGIITAVELLDDNQATSCRLKRQRCVWLLANIGGGSEFAEWKNGTILLDYQFEMKMDVKTKMIGENKKSRRCEVKIVCANNYWKRSILLHKPA